MKKNVGIVTWYNSDNYGSQLQAYALKKVIESLGYNVGLITSSHHPTLKKVIDIVLYRTWPFYYISYYKTLDKKKVFTKRFLNEIYLRSQNPLFDNFQAFVCGSDQIWAPNQFSPYYMLSFVPNEVNKISYAASIGLEEIPDELVEKYKKNIGRINHVSVREDTGKKLLKERCGIEATVVLDPTLLADKGTWDKIKKKSDIKSKYIFCYFLRKDHKYKEVVKEYAVQNDLEIYGVSDNPNDSEWMHLFNHIQVGPREFIGLVDEAHMIITDSYHGTIFRMLYHKKFVLFERFDSKDKICQNSRIEQLKTYFNIGGNVIRPDLISTPFLSSCKLIDYNDFESKLSILRTNSMNFLREALIP